MRALKYISIALGIILLFYVAEQGKKEKFLGLHGQTMGTFYNIKIRTDKNINQSELKQKIEQELAKINQQMSVFIKDSEINKINALPPQNKISLSTEMGIVLRSAQKIYNQTQGAFDPTVEPLIELWGFGKERNKPIPSNEEIRQALSKVGLKYIKINTNGTELIKQKQDLSLNLSAIAKGYGTDVVARLLEKKGIQNYMVEIGGEIAVKGISPSKKRWRIGVNKPTDDSTNTNNEIQTILNISDIAMATSGNYRNFYYKDGKKYAHTIDPKTGYPVQHSILSSTVLAKDCATADAYATAFMVLGLEKAKLILDKHPEIQAYFIYADENGKNQTYFTPKLEQMIQK